DRTFWLESSFNFKDLKISPLTVRKMANRFRVTAKGELRELKVDITLTLLGLEHKFEASGTIDGDTFTPRVAGSILGNKPPKLDPVKVASNGSVLNPMHPLNRLPNLRTGQTWRVPLVDPLADTVAACLPSLDLFGPRIEFLNAEVTEDNLTWRGKEVSCLVIEYRAPGKSHPSARTWTRRRDGLVLRQDAEFQGRKLVLERETE